MKRQQRVTRLEKLAAETPDFDVLVMTKDQLAAVATHGLVTKAANVSRAALEEIAAGNGETKADVQRILKAHPLQ